MSTVESLLADAAQLPVAERIRLIEAIWETLPDGDLPPQSEEWIAEIQRRSAKIDSGSMETVPWEQVQAEALRRVGGTVPSFSEDGFVELAEERFRTLDAEECEG